MVVRVVLLYRFRRWVAPQRRPMGVAANSAVDVDEVLKFQNIRKKVKCVFDGLLPLLLSGQTANGTSI